MGKGFSYFMVFDQKGINGAYTLDKAKELIRVYVGFEKLKSLNDKNSKEIKNA